MVHWPHLLQHSIDPSFLGKIGLQHYYALEAKLKSLVFIEETDRDDNFSLVSNDKKKH